MEGQLPRHARRPAEHPAYVGQAPGHWSSHAHTTFALLHPRRNFLSHCAVLYVTIHSGILLSASLSASSLFERAIPITLPFDAPCAPS